MAALSVWTQVRAAAIIGSVCVEAKRRERYMQYTTTHTWREGGKGSDCIWVHSWKSLTAFRFQSCCCFSHPERVSHSIVKEASQIRDDRNKKNGSQLRAFCWDKCRKRPVSVGGGRCQPTVRDSPTYHVREGKKEIGAPDVDRDKLFAFFLLPPTPPSHSLSAVCVAYCNGNRFLAYWWWWTPWRARIVELMRPGFFFSFQKGSVISNR
jgi:hypothetical protein